MLMHRWYKSRVERLLAIDQDTIVAEGEASRLAGDESVSKYVYAFAILSNRFDEAILLLRDLVEERESAGLALEALQCAAEEVLDCDEFNTEDGPIYAWLYKAQAACLKRIKAGENVSSIALTEDEIEAQEVD
jgi:hypothetical protein